MSNLTITEKIKLEKLLGMNSGYVLEFSNGSFQAFVLENSGLDIYDSKYEYQSGSKANRLRAFFDKESSAIVGRLIDGLLEYWKANKLTNNTDITLAEQKLHDECLEIPKRLNSTSLIENIESIRPNYNNKDFQLLAKSIKESIDKNEPELALDRLHTFTVKYVRELCNSHLINFSKNTPLHSLYGGYLKYLRENKLFDSKMAEKILKSSIDIFEDFNDVRNNNSFAHDNPILSNNESILIFNNISNIIRFIQSIEDKISEKNKKADETKIDWGDIPFSDEEIEEAGDYWIQSQIDISRGK